MTGVRMNSPQNRQRTPTRAPPRTRTPRRGAARLAFLDAPSLTQDPTALLALAAAFRAHQTLRRLSPTAIDRQTVAVVVLVDVLAAHGITHAAHLTPHHLATARTAVGAYAAALAGGSACPGLPPTLHGTKTARGRHRLLAAARAFGGWLEAQGHAPDPTAGLVLPRLPPRRHAAVLTHAEVARVLASPALDTPTGLRDRALLELAYATGLRRAELAALACADANLQDGSLRVTAGKGRRDRLVPLGQRARAWVSRYLTEARPRLLARLMVVDGWAAQEAAAAGRALWLTGGGLPMTGLGVGLVVRQHLEAAGLAGRGNCHLLRHSMATHLLEAGAGLGVVGALLGHQHLHTTQGYTQVSGEALAAHLDRARTVLGWVGLVPPAEPAPAPVSP